MPAPINCKPVADASWRITINSDTKRTAAKLASVTRARLRTSEVVTTIRRCSERPTKRRPTRVAEAVPARMKKSCQPASAA
jgi:hypothetical protein